jgi:hypothetical protein
MPCDFVTLASWRASTLRPDRKVAMPNRFALLVAGLLTVQAPYKNCRHFCGQIFQFDIHSVANGVDPQ